MEKEEGIKIGKIHAIVSIVIFLLTICPSFFFFQSTGQLNESVIIQATEASEYTVSFHVFNETSLDPIEGALVEILFTNFTVVTSNLTNLFGNVSFMLPGGSYVYNVTAAGYLETLSDEFLLQSNTTFHVGLWASIPLPVFITTPMSDENFFWENQTLAGNVTDARIVGIMYNVSSARGEYFGFASVVNQSFSVNITLMEGYNVFAVTGLNETGNPVGNDTVIAKLDRWRPAQNVMSNLFNETLSLDKKDFYIKSGEEEQKTSDIESRCHVDEKGRVIKYELDYTDEKGDKVGDLHITYTYDDKGKMTDVKLEFTDKDGNVINIQNLNPPNVVKDKKERITGFKYNFFVKREDHMIKIGDIEVKIEYHLRTCAPKVVTKIFTDGNGKPVRKTVTIFNYRWERIEEITVDEYGNPRKVGNTLKWDKIGDMHHKFTYEGRKRPLKKEEITPTDKKGNIDWKKERTVIEYDWNKKTKKTTMYKDMEKIFSKEEKITQSKSVSMETTFFDAYNNTLSVVNETYTFNVTYFGTGQTLTGTIVFSDVNDELAPPLPSLSIVQVTVAGETDNNTEVFLTYDDYVNITSMLYPGSNTVTIMVMDEAGNIMINSHVLEFKPVGGVWVPVDKFGLLAPYIALASTFLVATAATAIYVKHVKRRKKKQ